MARSSRHPREVRERAVALVLWCPPADVDGSSCFLFSPRGRRGGGGHLTTTTVRTVRSATAKVAISLC